MKNPFGKILRGIRNILLLLFVLSLLFVILYKYIPVYYTPYMFVRNVEQLVSGKKVHLGHQWKPLSGISPDLTQAVIASEDYMFLIHNGFDTDKTNLTVNRGARILYVENTTISQQTARNVFLL
ncbi:MAG: transglycosylase domain-containing protein, partial [Dysgonamonadaceae bacterium]|nr:transglycosylase domain-containing protein [Dysgonamonadaceae bacterium]